MVGGGHGSDRKMRKIRGKKFKKEWGNLDF